MSAACPQRAREGHRLVSWRRGPLVTLTMALGLAAAACQGDGGERDATAIEDGGQAGDAQPPKSDDAGPRDDAPPLGAQRLFDTTTLHEIRIDCDEAALGALAAGGAKRVSVTITIDGIVLPNSGARHKGYIASKSSEKPGFSIKLNEFVAGQRLDGIDRFLLNNSIQDPSFLNEPLAYEIHRLAGLAAPRTAHAVVTVGGKALGLYIVREAFDEEFLERHFGRAFRAGNLYEGVHADFAGEPERVELKDEIAEMRSREELVSFAKLVAEAPDDRFGSEVAARLDLDRFITAIAIDAVVGHWDNYSFGSNNYYVYSNPRDGRFVLLPHGMDFLFSAPAAFPTSAPTAELDPFVALAWPQTGAGPGRVAARLRAIPALEARYRAEIQRVAREVWNVQRLQALVDAVGAVAARYRARPGDDRVRADLARLAERLPTMRALVARRPAAVAAKAL